MDVNGSLLHEYFKTSRKLARYYDSLFKEIGLNVFQFINLCFIDYLKDENISVVSKSIGIDRSTLTRNSLVLVKNGILFKKENYGSDKRQSCFFLTDKGKMVLKHGEMIWNNHVCRDSKHVSEGFIESIILLPDFVNRVKIK